MEKKTRICKICNRSFSSGKAMGGHMRSHFAKLPLPPKPHSPAPAISISSSSSSSLALTSSHIPSRSFRSINHDLYISKPDLNADPVNGDTEIESPMSIATTRRRSIRRRKVVEKVAESGVARVVECSTEQASTVPDEIMKDEDVALCLLMLSKDSKGKKKVYDDDSEEELEINVDEDEDEDELFEEIPVRAKAKGRYRCETCHKYFKSYQALGGHKASHKKMKKEDEECKGAGIEIPGWGGATSSSVFVDQRIFKCPFCDKVFESGQALGGHKKVHLSYLATNNASTATTSDHRPKSAERLFDLNLPAREEEEDEDDVVELEPSQVHGHQNGKRS